MSHTAAPWMLLYLGRRGMRRFVLDLARATTDSLSQPPTLTLARQGDTLEIASDTGAKLLAVETFTSNLGAVTHAWTLRRTCAALSEEISRRRIGVVLDVMPHVWSPYIASCVHATSAMYVPILHDATSHPGDRTAVVRPLVRSALRHADRVVTLSASVADVAAESGLVDSAKIISLFHPDLAYVREPIARRPPDPGNPLKMLFLGRVLPYKGLSTFVRAAELLRSQGRKVQVGVWGEGSLGELGHRLVALEADIQNRWLSDIEIAEALRAYDVLVASHAEASQSGAVAAGLGAGMPCIVTPVGGLVEQVTDGATGLVTGAASPECVASAIVRLIESPNLYSEIARRVILERPKRSMDRFVHCLSSSLTEHLDRRRS